MAAGRHTSDVYSGTVYRQKRLCFVPDDVHLLDLEIQMEKLWCGKPGLLSPLVR